MGWFSNGIVFTSAPDFKAASTIVPDRCARGYKHRQQAVWLLDLWKPRGKLQLRRAPFCDPFVSGFRADLAGVDGATRTFLTAIEQIQQALEVPGAEASYVHLALALAEATQLPAFVFVANDEEIDMGCNAIPGSLASFGCRLDRLSIRFLDGQTEVTPINHVEDDDEEGVRERIDAVKPVAGISVKAPRDVEGGQILYENPVAQWPHAAGDPVEMLGLGTWEPLMNLERDFAVVFEKLNS